MNDKTNGFKQKVSLLREKNLNSKLGFILTILAPLWIVLVTEINQKGNLSSFLTIVKTPSILLFDFLFVFAIYGFILLLVKRSWISATITGVAMFILSCVEFYRYRASGAHFTMGDFSLFTNVGDAAKFAKIQIYPSLVIMLLLLLAYLSAMFMFTTKINFNWKHIVPGCSAIAVSMVAFFMVPTISTPIFQAFNINHGSSANNFILEEKFQDNGMISFLVENVTDTIKTVNIKAPKNYSEQAVKDLAVEVQAIQPKVKPNVIMIMSESYTDFRKFEELNVSDDYYTNFDIMSNEGFKGTAFVPTFGGYTVKSEFELLFGLPIKSLNGTQAPQSLINDEEQLTIANYYKTQGYHTAYMHPYTREFYDRGELLPRYSFDNIYFQEEIPGENFRRYRDDKANFDMAVKEIKDNEDPTYIHITTMQNHMPYNLKEGQTEFDYYMEGIKNTDKRLGELMEELKNIDEPTVVMMVGDHFPFFTEENSAYKKLGVTSENCQELYEQPYVVWANYDQDFSSMPTEVVSLFYLPHILIDSLGLEKSELGAIMDKQIEVSPIYTLEYDENTKNEVLDTITYDIILGDGYAKNK